MTPQLRFPEFTDEWQVKKLGDIVKFGRGGALSKDELDDGGKYSAIHYGQLFTEYNEIISKVVSRTNVNTGKTSEVGDILMPTSDVTPQGLARASVINENGVMLGGDINVLKPNSFMSSSFMSYMINSQKKKIMRLVSGTTVRHVYASEVSKALYRFPSKPEQEKIADFLTAVDERIAVGEKKLELLETYKRGVMQKIFSQQVRFKDESGKQYPDWEEKKLGEVSKIKTGDSDVQDAVADGEYPFFIRSKEVKRSNKYIYDGEAILIPGEGGIGEIFHYINGKFNYHQRVYKISDFDAKTHGKYVLYFIHQNFARQANKHSVKATVDSLRLPTFTDFSVSLPCKEEQQKIATFLTTLDDKITAEKSKLTAARKFKRALLQRMFA